LEISTRKTRTRYRSPIRPQSPSLAASHTMSTPFMNISNQAQHPQQWNMYQAGLQSGRGLVSHSHFMYILGCTLSSVMTAREGVGSVHIHVTSKQWSCFPTQSVPVFDSTKWTYLRWSQHESDNPNTGKCMAYPGKWSSCCPCWVIPVQECLDADAEHDHIVGSQNRNNCSEQP
jgi:hypothetical protein